MAVMTGEKFTRREISIDGSSFVDCEFVDCKLVFGATAPVTFDGCTFDGSEWVFEGAASSTLEFLSVLSRGLEGEGQDLIEGIFQSVKEGSLQHRRYEPIAASAA